LIQHIYRDPNHPLLPLITVRRKERQHHRNRRREFTKSLFPKPSERDEFLATIPTLHLPRLQQEFPKRLTWAAETPDAMQAWGQFFEQRNKPDQRIPDKPVTLVPEAGWTYTVKEDENIVVKDQETGAIVLMVVRKWCGTQDIIDWVSRIAAGALEKKKSVRLEDPGKLVLMGYTSGSRSSPSLGWARNLLPAATAEFTKPEVLEKFNFQTSSTYALLWQMALHRLPSAILADYRTMAGHTMDSDGQSPYWGIELGNDYFEFHHVELAPPQGGYAINYSRHCHRETNATEYCIAWTTERSNPVSEGGHFYVASYGVRVHASTDMMVVWRGLDWHGTTLPKVEPSKLDDQFCQLGLGITVSRRILSLLEKYKQEGLSEGMFSSGEDAEEDGLQ
jgi:hypothetical protein